METPTTFKVEFAIIPPLENIESAVTPPLNRATPLTSRVAADNPLVRIVAAVTPDSSVFPTTFSVEFAVRPPVTASDAASTSPPRVVGLFAATTREMFAVSAPPTVSASVLTAARVDAPTTFSVEFAVRPPVTAREAASASPWSVVLFVTVSVLFAASAPFTSNTCVSTAPRVDRPTTFSVEFAVRPPVTASDAATTSPPSVVFFPAATVIAAANTAGPITSN